MGGSLRDADEEAALAAQLKQARAALVVAVGWEAPGPGRPAANLSGNAPTLEQVAEAEPALLAKYTHAVNELWLHAENTGITRRNAQAWVRLNKRRLRESGTATVDVHAEATFAMREQVINFAVHGDRAGLERYSRPGVFAALNEFVGRELSAVTGMGRGRAQKQRWNDREEYDET